MNNAQMDLDLLGRHDEIELDELGIDQGGRADTITWAISVQLSIAFCPTSACSSKC